MSTEFKVRIRKVMTDAIAEKDKRNADWKAALKSISWVLNQVAEELPDAQFKDSNGDGLSLVLGEDKLEFRLDPARRKIIRTSTREAGEREYDLEKKIEAAKIEGEAEEFVHAVYAD